MTGHLWVLVVLPWDGFLVSFSVGLFPSGVGCRRLYCGSRIFCRSDWDSGITLLNWYRFFGNFMCQLLLRSISFTDSWGESLWLRRQFGCCQPFVVETTSWFPEETNPLQTKFCVICRRSFSEFAVTRTFTDLSSVGSVEIHQIFFRGESLVLQSWRRVTVEVHQTFSEVGFFTERSRCWRLFSFRTCLWYRRWLNRSITSGFCPHCLYEAKGSDSLQIAGSSPDFLLGGHHLQRYAH